MTVGENGTPDPGNDDPFAYLYRSDGAEGGGEPQQPEPGPGVPRTSFHHVQRVGERRQQAYGAPGGYGPAQGQQPGGYGYPQAAQPVQPGPGQVPGPGGPGSQPTQPIQTGVPGRAAARRAAAGAPGGSGHGAGHGGGRGAGRGPHRKGLLIGAVAVVAVVAICIAFAMTRGPGGPSVADGPSPKATASHSASPSGSPSADGAEDTLPGTVDAATLVLGGGAQQSTQWPGAKAAGGTYVDHMNQTGASVSWTFDVSRKGAYTLYIGYAVAGKDASATVTTNGDAQQRPLPNYAHAKDNDWAHGWTESFAWVTLKAGQNTVKVSCEQGDQCAFNLDQLWLKKGHRNS
jgi:hypothetical protein